MSICGSDGGVLVARVCYGNNTRTRAAKIALQLATLIPGVTGASSPSPDPASPTCYFLLRFSAARTRHCMVAFIISTRLVTIAFSAQPRTYAAPMRSQFSSSGM
jgi:hypothetical protein